MLTQKDGHLRAEDIDNAEGIVQRYVHQVQVQGAVGVEAAALVVLWMEEEEGQNAGGDLVLAES